MDLINANDLIAAGYTFTIEDENSERQFDEETGELRGVQHEMSWDYEAYDGSGAFSEGLADTLEFTDDAPHLTERGHYDDDGFERFWVEPTYTNGRWAHLADTHIEEREMQRGLYRSLPTKGVEYGEMQTLKEWREERYEKLLRFAETADRKHLHKLFKGVQKRYVDSVRSCAKSGEWFKIYLTKEQKTNIQETIKRRWKQRR